MCIRDRAYGRVERNGTYANANGAPFSGTGGGFGYTCFTNATCYTGSSNNVATGWTAGGGFEYALAQHWTFKGEYLYVSLDSKSVTETAVSGNGGVPASFNANFSRTNLNIARLGLNYRF